MVSALSRVRRGCPWWAASILCGLWLWPPAVGAAAPPAHRAPHVVWAEGGSWPEVTARAAAEGRPILIDFYAQWCGPCKAMEAMVYNEPEVIAELRDVLTFKVDVDDARYDELEKRLGITRLPTLVFCDSDGTPWDRFTGYVTADTFLVRIRRWKEGLSREREFMAELASAPDDPQVLAAAYARRRREGRLAEAETFRQRLLMMTGNTRRHEAARALVSFAAQDMRDGEAEQARTLARGIEGMFPAEGLDLDRKVRRADVASLELVAGLQSQLPDTLGLLETYAHMISLDRGCLPALEGFARTALAAGVRLPQATTNALRAVIRSDNRPDLMALLAECYQRRSYHARAVKWMEKAVAGEPDNQRFRQDLARYKDTCPAWLLSSP